MSAPDSIKTNEDHPCHGLIATMRTTLQYLEGSWQYQIFNNLDELRQSLKGKIPDQELQQFIDLLELSVKKPLRRQIGRLQSLKRSIDELSRYLS